MSRKKIIFNSTISLIIIFISLFIFIDRHNQNFTISDLLSYITIGWQYLLSASILLILSVVIRAFRWQYLFKSNNNQKIKDLFSAQLIGYFINNIFPIRIGDFGKSYLIAKKNHVNTSYIFGSIVMERVLDTIMLFIFLLILILNYGLYYLNINFSFLSILALLIILFLIFILFYYKHNFLPQSINTILSEVWNGFTEIKTANKSIVFFLSFSIWSIYCVNVFLIQSIFTFFDLTFFDCLFLLVASSFIQMIPSGFGALGIFHLGAEAVLIKLGVHNYYHFIILLWFYSYFIYTTLGSYYFIKEGKFTFKNLYNDLLKND